MKAKWLDRVMSDQFLVAEARVSSCCAIGPNLSSIDGTSRARLALVGLVRLQLADSSER